MGGACISPFPIFPVFLPVLLLEPQGKGHFRYNPNGVHNVDKEHMVGEGGGSLLTQHLVIDF